MKSTYAVTVITVTYARRWEFLEKTLAAALHGGAVRAIVIDNDAVEDVAQKAERTFGDRVRVLRLPTNQGSAGGYCAGITAARQSGEEFLLLLDDDNCVAPGAIQVLKDTYNMVSAGTTRDDLCLVAFRPSRQAEVFEGRRPDSLGGVPGAFFGIHFRQIPIKIWNRLRSRRDPNVRNPAALERLYSLRVAPYGGMFLHRSVFERYGIPNSNFMIYLDDTEFSLRITRSGGRILLVPQAQINDLEQSWGLDDSCRTSLDRWLLLGSNKQVFYTARNRAYIEYRLSSSKVVYMFNRCLVFGVLRLLARALKKEGRLRLIERAVKCGERGDLGVDPAFPL